VEQAEALKNLKVVYVEDEDMIRASVARIIKRRVKELHVGKDGLEGLELVKKYQPDIVITDIEMPIMNGLEMIKKIRQEQMVNVPIIAMTAYQDDEHYTELATAYIYKPVNASILFEAMAQYPH
jgi:YesN/AraC family two-component response regulator